MEFTIEFYETSAGRCPVHEFLDELKKFNPYDFAAVLAGLAKLRNREYNKPRLSKGNGDDVFELRHVGKLNTRVLYFFTKGQRIILSPWHQEKDESSPGTGSTGCPGKKE